MKLDEKWKVVLAVGAVLVGAVVAYTMTWEVRCSKGLRGDRCVRYNKLTGWSGP